MGGMQMGGGAMELLGLLRIEEVRKDKQIDMDESTWETISTAQRDIMGDMRNFRDMSEDERAAKMKEMGDKAKDLVDEALSPGQQERLMGLIVQRNGVRSVMNDMIADKIGMTADDTKKVQAAMTKATEGMRAKFEEFRNSAGEGERPDFTKMREMMTEAQKDVEKAIEGELSKSHKEQLEALKGAKFDFPEEQRGGFGGGRPGGAGGQPGNRPRGGRPGGDNPPN